MSSSLILFDFSFYFSPHFTVFFLSFLSMHADSDFDSMTNNLRDSANGTFVTSDDSSQLTGYEPNDMELIDTEPNDSVPSNFTDLQDSLVHFAPSSDHDVDDETLGKLLAEVHRDYADYRRPEGVRVSPSSMSVMVDRKKWTNSGANLVFTMCRLFFFWSLRAWRLWASVRVVSYLWGKGGLRCCNNTSCRSMDEEGRKRTPEK